MLLPVVYHKADRGGTILLGTGLGEGRRFRLTEPGARPIIDFEMKPCRKKVVLGFGAVLLVVLLYVPYRSVSIRETRQGGSNLITRMTTGDRGFLFLPRFLKAVSRNPAAGAKGDTYRLDAGLYAGEIAAVLILAVLDFFLLCPKGPARKPGQGF